jgi:hypothetical protein
MLNISPIKINIHYISNELTPGPSLPVERGDLLNKTAERCKYGRKMYLPEPQYVV